MSDEDSRIQAQLMADWTILRTSVSVDHVSDDELKRVFVQNGCDIVKSLLAVEEMVSGLRPYETEQRLYSKTERKLRRLRFIANEKDQIARQKSQDSNKTT